MNRFTRWRPLNAFARFRPAFLLLACLVGVNAPPARAEAGYYRYPAIFGDTVIFTAEGDLWRASVQGGLAQRLTSDTGEESHAQISPDGQTIAFTGEYEGPAEVYTMPLAGGLPVRHTWLGRLALVVGWTPQGEILYATSRYSTFPSVQLVRLDPRTGTQSVVPLSQASDGAFDSTGVTLYFTRFPTLGSCTKRYTGGAAQGIWKYTDGAAEALNLTGDYPGTSRSPMVFGGRIYFLSDRDGIMNLWSMTPDGHDLRQHTHSAEWDADSPSLGQGRIVYQLGADLYLCDLRRDTTHKIDLSLASDFDQMRETWVKKPMDYLTAVHPSPDGDRVVLTSRGQVFVAPAQEGRRIEVTRQTGVRLREARFLADGISLTALSDETGEVELCRLPANGVGAGEILTHGSEVTRWDQTPSPDGSGIAYQDRNQELWIFDLKTRVNRKIASSADGPFSDLRWSPDGRWLAFVRLAANQFSQILLYSLQTGTTLTLTSDRFDSGSPAWSPDGRWLYFLSDRHFRSVTASPWGSRQPEPFLDRSTGIYLAALRRGERSPFRPPDELDPKEMASEADHGDDGSEPDAGLDGDRLHHGGRGPDEGRRPDRARGRERTDDEKSEPVKVDIDPEGLMTRIEEVPVEPGNYEALSVNDARLFFVSRETAAEPARSLLALAIHRDPDHAPKTVVDDLDSYELCQNGRKLLIRKGDELYLIETESDSSIDLPKFAVDLADWTFPIAPREERRQILMESWRGVRDYFYDPAMHGVDWPAVLKKYLPLTDRITDRKELTDVLENMVGELSALHMFVWGGDERENAEQIHPASLGAVLARDEAAGGYRVSQIYRSDPDLPSQLSPLAQPGAGLVEGDVIEQIDGVDVLSCPDPAVLLRRQAGKQVLLRVRPSGASAIRPPKRKSTTAREVIVMPITEAEDRDLRCRDWEYSRRLLVERLSGGTIGYVHLRAMNGEDYASWAREFYPIFQRQGLIIDVRGNSGGNIDSWILEKLMRRAWMWWKPRVGNPSANMQYAFQGHMVVLCDENTFSDGEAFAEGFRRLGLGKVIGTRTQGGEIWLNFDRELVDNGTTTAGESGVYGPEGRWLIEGHGVDPDIVVDNPPHATFMGEDAQLQTAVGYLQELIRTSPVGPPAPPPYPVKAWPPRGR